MKRPSPRLSSKRHSIRTAALSVMLIGASSCQPQAWQKPPSDRLAHENPEKRISDGVTCVIENGTLGYTKGGKTLSMVIDFPSEIKKSRPDSYYCGRNRTLAFFGDYLLIAQGFDPLSHGREFLTFKGRPTILNSYAVHVPQIVSERPKAVLENNHHHYILTFAGNLWRIDTETSTRTKFEVSGTGFAKNAAMAMHKDAIVIAQDGRKDCIYVCYMDIEETEYTVLPFMTDVSPKGPVSFQHVWPDSLQVKIGKYSFYVSRNGSGFKVSEKI